MQEELPPEEPQERKYSFAVRKEGRAHPEQIVVAESDLSMEQIHILTGQLLHHFSTLPAIAQDMFIQAIMQKAHKEQEAMHRAALEQMERDGGRIVDIQGNPLQ